MKLELRTVGEIIAVASVVFSLLFVGYELRLSRSIAESEQIEANATLNTNLRELILLNSDVWNRGCLGEELTPNEKMVFNNIEEAANLFRYTQWAKASAGIYFGGNQDTLEPETAAMRLALNRYRYPGFNQAYIEGWEAQRNDTEYDAEELELESWALAVENAYQSLIASGAPRDFYDGWCGR